MPLSGFGFVFYFVLFFLLLKMSLGSAEINESSVISKITFLTKTVIEVPCSVITRSRSMGQFPHSTARFMGQKLSNTLVERGLYNCLCRVTTVLTPSDYSFIKTLTVIECRTKPWEVEFNIKVGSAFTGILHQITSGCPFQLTLFCDSMILCSVVMKKTQGKSEMLAE